MTTSDGSRAAGFTRGMEVINAINGGSLTALADSLADISPELGYQIVSWAFGDIYSRPALPPRDRQLLTLAMLTALGGCEAQLRVHIPVALDVGLRPEEIVEVFLQSAVYCGLPKALNATFEAKKVFAERGLLKDAT